MHLDDCRKILGAGAADLTDEEIKRRRDGIFLFARIIMDICAKRRGTLAVLTTDDREGVEERAAIREFDGGQSNGSAERAAVLDFCRRPKKSGHQRVNDASEETE